MLTPAPRLRPIPVTALVEPLSRFERATVPERRRELIEMGKAPASRRLLFISNGYGEDSIAAAIIRQLPDGVSAEAYPTLGDGHAFARVCPVVGPRAQLASEGWRNVRGSLARDLTGGGLMTIWPGIKFVRRVRHHYDHFVVVGDLVGVAGCFACGLSRVTYLDVYKTGYGRGYAAPERWLIGHTARTAFCRSDALAASLRVAGIDARFAGNVMMDTISYGDYDVAARRSRPRAVTLLPGSRQLTSESFALQVAALRQLPESDRPDVFLSVAGSVSALELARAAGLKRTGPMTGEPGDLGSLSDGDFVVHMAGGAAGNLIEASDVVLSQAGTATIQALGSGKPVITFVNPRDRSSRFRDESALFDAARVVTAPHPTAIAAVLQRLLTDADERARLGAIGRERIGGTGAIHAIIESLVE